MKESTPLSMFPILLTLCVCGPLTCCNAGAVSPSSPIKEATQGPTSIRVTIEQLLEEPEKYADKFIEVQGINGGGLAIPGCEGWIGAPTRWSLHTARPSHTNVPPYILIGGSVDDKSAKWARGEPVEVTFWGWQRLYDGPRGCYGRNPSKRDLERGAKVKVWYVEAIRMQVHD